MAGCAFSMSWNSGQICMVRSARQHQHQDLDQANAYLNPQASSRLYVQEKVATEFLAKYKAAFGVFKHGDPFHASTTMGYLLCVSYGLYLLY